MRDRLLPFFLLLSLLIAAAACDPATPRTGTTEPADGGVDRIILTADAGGAGCVATAHDAGTEDMSVGGAGGGGGIVGANGGGTTPADAGAAATGGMRAAEGGKAGSASDGKGGAGATGGGGTAGHGGGGGSVPSTSSSGGGGASGGGSAAGAGAGGVAGQAGLGGAAGAVGGGGQGGGGGVAGQGGVRGAAASGQGGFGGTVAIAPPPDPGDLTIVELLINPAGTDTGREWVEVMNRTPHALDLSSLHVADAANDAAVDFSMAGGALLPAGARAVLIQSADVTKNGGIALTTTFGGSFGTRVSLNNDADTISVCVGACAAGVFVDQFSWDASLGTAYDDHALSIDDGGRRCPAMVPFGDAGSFGTPGTANPPCP